MNKVTRNSLEISTFHNTDSMANYIWNHIELSNVKNIVIPGGSSIIPFYEKLERSDLTNFEFFLSDERMAGPNNINSNQFQIHMKYKNLGSKTYGFYSNDYEKKLLFLNQNPFVTILGVGSDGHFASLFPKDLNFSESTIQRTFQKDGEPYQRMSMGFELIAKSSQILLWIHGASKHNIIKMLDEMDLSIPICKLVNDYKSMKLICDFKFLIG